LHRKGFRSFHHAASASLAALRGQTEAAVAGFASALTFPFLRLDRAEMQALFATVVGREVPEARQAADEARELLAEIGATAYLDLYAAGLATANRQRAAGA
jgi:hypothetical protein